MPSQSGKGASATPALIVGVGAASLTVLAAVADWVVVSIDQEAERRQLGLVQNDMKDTFEDIP